MWFFSLFSPPTFKLLLVLKIFDLILHLKQYFNVAARGWYIVLRDSQLLHSIYSFRDFSQIYSCRAMDEQKTII